MNTLIPLRYEALRPKLLRRPLAVFGQCLSEVSLRLHPFAKRPGTDQRLPVGSNEL